MHAENSLPLFLSVTVGALTYVLAVAMQSESKPWPCSGFNFMDPTPYGVIMNATYLQVWSSHNMLQRGLEIL